jgi:dCTP deaminase
VIYADRQIMELLREQGAIRPWTQERVQPASYDLTLGNVLKRWHKDEWMEFRIPYEGYELPRGELLLFSTAEYVMLPDDIAARVEGKSSIGRRGLFIHVTAGWIDPGFQGEITLEMYAVGPTPVRVMPGMAICQIAFMQCTGPAARAYGHAELGSKYQGQTGVTEAR